MAIKYVQGLGKEEGGKYYQYRFMVNGKVHTGSTGQEKLADAKKELARIRQKTNSKAKGTLYTPTWKEATEDWLVEKATKSPSHIRTAKGFAFKHLSELDAKRVDQILPDDVKGIVRNFISEGGSRSSANIIIRYYHGVMNMLVEKGSIIGFKKIDKESVQKKPHAYIPKERIQEFLTSIDRTNNLHQSIAIRVMLYAGLREREALNIKWEYLNIQTGKYYLDHTKNMETGSIKFPQEVLDWLLKLEHRKGLIIPAEDGNAHRQGFTKKAMERASKDLGIKVTPHRCRTTFITTLAQKNLNALMIQKLARHSDIRTTLIYTNLENSELDKAVDNLFD